MSDNSRKCICPRSTRFTQTTQVVHCFKYVHATLSGKGAAVFAEGLSGAVASGLGKVRYLN